MFSLPNEIYAAVLGALLGAWITYRFAMRLAERQFQHLKEISKLDAWRASRKELILAFGHDLAMLESGANLKMDLPDFLRAAFEERHARAIVNFQLVMPESEREDFKTKWNRHCFGPDSDGRPMAPEDVGMEHDQLLFLHYSDHYDPTMTAAPRKLAAQRIRALLYFARET